MDIIAIGKVIVYIATGGIGLMLTVIGFLLKRELGRNKDSQQLLQNDITDLKKVQNEQQKITATHDKDIAVMNAEKIGRPELKEEMDKIQQGFEAKLTLFKDDLKEDIKELKDIIVQNR